MQKSNRPSSVKLVFPIKGQAVDSSRGMQPEFTSPSMVNVLPFDTGNRFRGGQRHGLSKFYASNLSSDHVAAICATLRSRLDNEFSPNTSADFTEDFAGTGAIDSGAGYSDWVLTEGVAALVGNGTSYPPTGVEEGPPRTGLSPKTAAGKLERSGGWVVVAGAYDNTDYTAYAALQNVTSHAVYSDGYAIQAEIQLADESPSVQILDGSDDGVGGYNANAMTAFTVKLFAQAKGDYDEPDTAEYAVDAYDAGAKTIVVSELVGLWNEWAPVGGLVARVASPGGADAETKTIVAFDADTGTITIDSAFSVSATGQYIRVKKGWLAYTKQIVTLAVSRRFMCVYQGEYGLTNAGGGTSFPVMRDTRALQSPGLTGGDTPGSGYGTWWVDFPEPLDAATTYTIELRVLGDRAYGYLNGRLIVDAGINAALLNRSPPYNYVVSPSSLDRRAGFSLGAGPDQATANGFKLRNFKIFAYDTSSTGSKLDSPEVRIVGVSDGKVFVGDAGSSFVECLHGSTYDAEQAAAANQNISNITNLRDDTRNFTILAPARENVFAVDGRRTLRIDVQRNFVYPLINRNPMPTIVDGKKYKLVPDLKGVTGGSIPQSCQICCMWRDRLVLARPEYAPHTWYMSVTGQYTNFDSDPVVYGDAAAAFGSTSTGANIGDPIRALMPFNDDILVFGCDGSLVRLSGDPNRGGTLDVVSASVGVQGPLAWTQADDGSIYFVGPAGFYRMLPEGLPERISTGRMDSVFRQITNTTDYRIVCQWDRENDGCWIFVTPKTVSGGTYTHYFYSRATDGFFPIRYATYNHNPLCAHYYDGPSPTDRVMLLGGRDGYIRKPVQTAVTDDSSAISSECWIGPIRPYEDAQSAVLTELELVMGELSGTFNAVIEVFAAQGDYEGTLTPAASNGARKLSITLSSGGRATKRLMRLTGNTFYFKISNTTGSAGWNFEKLIATFQPGGMQKLR